MLTDHLRTPLLAATLIAVACAHATPATPAPDPAPGASAAPAAPAALGPEAAGKLHGYLFKLSCGEAQDARSCKLDPAQERSRLDVTLGGDPGTVYDLALRVRGLMEPRRYTGGALHAPGNKLFYAGGAPDPLRKNNGQAYNVYQIAVSDPRQDYFLNRDTDDALGSGYTPSHSVFNVDYTVTIKARGGATVSVITDDQPRSGMINNADKLVVAGLPEGLIPQPWDGQFFYIEVTSLTPTGAVADRN
jgi:hypothetical protein